jgi:hypothetical protein
MVVWDMSWVGWGLAGIVATLVMDIGSGVLRSTGLTRGATPQLIGRFFSSVFRGHLTRLDPSLPADAPVSFGLILPVHYAIGVTLALLFGVAARMMDGSPRWWACVLFGLGTTALPAFWMFPAMGFGVLGTRGPEKLLLLRTAVVNHLFFGLGLALAAPLVVPRFQ